MTLGDKLRKAGLDVTLRWERQTPRSSRRDFLTLYRTEKAILGEPKFQRLGFWLEKLPDVPAWHSLVEDALARYRSAFVRVNFSDGEFEYYLRCDRTLHTDLYERLRELRWSDAAESAQRHGITLPHLLEGDLFSIRGHNLQVADIGNHSLRVSLLDETGKFIAAADLYQDVGIEPPVARGKPGSGSARGNKNLILELVS